jgi:hypothetical protein
VFDDGATEVDVATELDDDGATEVEDDVGGEDAELRVTIQVPFARRAVLVHH